MKNKKKVERILLSGAHGTGKTTAGMHLASQLKLENPARSVRFEAENVRAVSKLVNGQTHPEEFQEAIFYDLLLKDVLVRASDHYSHIVHDRAAIDSIAYSRAFGVHVPKEHEILAVRQAKSFDQVYLVVSTGRKLADDGFRMTDQKFQKKVEKEFLKLFKKHRIKHEKVYVRSGKMFRV